MREIDVLAIMMGGGGSLKGRAQKGLPCLELRGWGMQKVLDPRFSHFVDKFIL